MAVLSEERVVEDWLELTETGRSLLTENDGPVTVLLPGRRNDDHGPDFRDAILATRRGIVVGDIEVHVDSSGWRAHGHHTDPAYNRVVLHVVHRHASGRDAVLFNGRTVPTLVIGGEETAPVPPPELPGPDAYLPCRTGGRSPEAAAAFLDEAGIMRFREHAAAFRSALERASPDRVLYAGLLAALGYRRNREPMQRLAVALPLETVAGDASLDGREALLIGAAGLLPSQRTRRFAGDTRHPRVRRLEAAWARHGGAASLSEADWHHARVRPGNYPVRRLAAMARLLARYRRSGLAGGILAGLAAARCPRELAALVTVPAAGYWKNSLDFGVPAAGTAPALCGPGRAADIVVNVLLPFAAAWYRSSGYPEGAAAMVNQYREHPALADNVIIGEVRQRLGLPRPVTALHQQGMLHLHAYWCAAGRCRACPLG